MTPSEYEQLVARIEKRRRKRDEAAGALKEAMKLLRKQFKCETLEEAEALLEQLEAKEKKCLRQVEKAKEAFDEKWQSHLEELP